MERLWELDFLRGFSVVLMVLYNWSYALSFLNIYSIFPSGNFLYWNIFPLMVAAYFMFIAGISLTLSWNRSKPPSLSKHSVRGVKIFLLGMIITGVTWLTFPENFVFFGILHLIGASIFFGTPLIDSPRKSGLVAITIFLAYFLVGILAESSLILASIGLASPPPTFDYFPLIPWTGVVFLGITFGHWVYPDGERRTKISRPKTDLASRFADLVQLLGRNSLKIYLFHQPVLILLLVLLGYQVL